MANEEHVEILKKGVAVWNKWRREHPSEEPDFNAETVEVNFDRADLRRVNLRDADLSLVTMERADLRNAQLERANLTGARMDDANLSRAALDGVRRIEVEVERSAATTLRRANLDGASLVGADFGNAVLTDARLRRTRADEAVFELAQMSHVDLSGAELVGAVFHGAHLVDANFDGAVLYHTDFTGTTLRFANFSETLLGSTQFVAVDLSEVRGLSQCKHFGSSIIDVRTLELSRNVPSAFLRGCGVSDVWFQLLPIASGRAIEFFSCFISYSHADRVFAHRLHDALQARGIRCWLDHHEVLPGDNVYRAINEAIRIWDKVLLCCSESSLKSWWVKDEVTRALEKEQRLEKERGKEVLAIIPLDLDDHLFRPECDLEFAPTLRKRHAAKFAGWQNDRAIFDTQLERVVRALRADDGARAGAPVPKL